MDSQALIRKFPLMIMHSQSVSMPKNARILSAQMQYGVPCIWAILDPSELMEKRTFLVRGTGNPITDQVGEFIATVQQVGEDWRDPAFAWHIFELKDVER